MNKLLKPFVISIIIINLIVLGYNSNSFLRANKNSKNLTEKYDISAKA